MEWGTTSSWVAIGVTIGLAFYTWYANSRRATAEDVSSLQNRLTTLEAEVKSMPSMDAFHKLEIVVTRVEGHQRVFDAELKPIAAAVGRIEKFLIESVTPKSTRK